jgi:hypothetical protein
MLPIGKHKISGGGCVQINVVTYLSRRKVRPKQEKISELSSEPSDALESCPDAVVHRCFGRRAAIRESAEAQPASNGQPGLSVSMTSGA